MLDGRVWVVQPREFLRTSECGVAVVLVNGDSVVHERVVEKNPSIINALVKSVGVPLTLWHRKKRQSVVDGELDFNVTPVVINKPRPARRLT